MAIPALKFKIEALDGYSDAMRKVKTRMAGLKVAASGVSKGLQTSAKITAGAMAAIGGAAAYAVKGVVGVGSTFEQMQVVLETVEGSAEKAQKSVNWIKDFAVSTPYELEQVQQAFVNMRAFGIDPTTGALESVGNAAAAIGIDIGEGVATLTGALTGENERLKRFGVSVRYEGEKVVYSWQENGKTIEKAADRTNKAMIQSLLLGMWNSRYGGAMDKLSKTFGGMWSNIQDQFTKFQLMIANSGIFEEVKASMAEFLATLDEMEKSGKLQELADVIGRAMVDAFRALKRVIQETDFKALFEGFVKSVKDIGAFVDAIGGIKSVLIGLGAAISMPAILAVGQLFAAFAAFLSAPALAALIAAGGIAAIFSINQANKEENLERVRALARAKRGGTKATAERFSASAIEQARMARVADMDAKLARMEQGLTVTFEGNVPDGTKADGVPVTKGRPHRVNTGRIHRTVAP